jgi:hypothetical protein
MTAVGIPPEFKDPVDTVDISGLRNNVVDLKIPPEFRDSLGAIEISDHRSDEEILLVFNHTRAGGYALPSSRILGKSN